METLFNGIFNDLNNNVLGRSLREVRKFIDSHPYMMYDDGLEDIERDYGLMLDYMKRGFADEHRKNVYKSLIDRLYIFVSNLYMAYRIQNSPFYTEASRKSINQSFSNDRIKNTLESFVTDVAMLSLESESTRKEKERMVYTNHNSFRQALFCYIVVSRQWTENDSDFFKSLLLSPVIDVIDAQLIVNALTLAVMNNMDINKFAVLIKVYLETNNEKIRQKALVGWVFSLSSRIRIHEKLQQLIKEALKDENVKNELVDLQKQIILCMNAEKDTDKIQRDIMPDIVKNNNLNITRFGISEKEEDPMADVFDPGASDRAMEKMEESFQKMMNMQKAGSDIYFGGFSQMKRFPFFYNLANWFCPFYKEHPEISKITDITNGSALLDNILSNGPFCDSDKYSFTIALTSVIKQIPEGMREMLGSKDILGPTMSNEEQKSPAYIRRMVLQDMYRFFRLYHQRNELVNPFDNDNCIFVSNPVFAGTSLCSAYSEIAYFTLKYKNIDALKTLLDCYYNPKDIKCLLIHGIFELDYNKDPQKAIEHLEMLYIQDPKNKRGLSLLARAHFELGNYEHAVVYYEELYLLDKQNKTTTLNFSIALSKAKQYDKARVILYGMTLEDNPPINVTRVLAWILMGQNKLELADREYSHILNSDETENGDYLNAGYCKWFMGDIGSAIEMFNSFISASKKTASGNNQIDIESEMKKDYDILTDHGITDVDFRLMIDILSE